MVTFGEVIQRARKEKMISQKDLAGMIRKEDGESISQQYLSDIEHGRRVPSSDHLIKQFAETLDLDPDVLATRADELPETARQLASDRGDEEVKQAWTAFRKELE